MATSTAFDQHDILTYFLTLGPFTYVLTTNPPAGTEGTVGGLGSNVCDYPSYANKTLFNTDFSSPTTSGATSSISNLADINFITPTGNGTHTIGGFALFDNSGQMRRYGPLQAVLPAPQSGQPIKTPAGQLIISEG